MSKEKTIARQSEIQALRDEGATLAEIGKVFFLSRERIRQILKADYSRVKDTETPLVEKYPQLRNMQGREYNRELVRIRDNHTCQLCGHKWVKGERRLDIHHLDCDKEKTRQYDKPSEFGNLITLCHGCHLNVPEHRNSMKKINRQNKA